MHGLSPSYWVWTRNGNNEIKRVQCFSTTVWTLWQAFKELSAKKAKT